MISFTYLGIVCQHGGMNKKKIKMFKMKTIMILMSIMKISRLIKIHQINNISYTILVLITNKNLLTLIFYVHMNFLIRQIKSTTSVVINLIMNTFNTTPTTFIQSTKNSSFTKLHNTSTKKTTLKITPKQFILYLHHGIQILTSN